MSTKFDARLYEDSKMDKEIEMDVADLRMLLKDAPEPEEPHPAYWNNFLLRVHERIETEAAPKKKPWWSPALIWGSLSGVAAMLVIAWSVGIFPFGSRNGGEYIADKGVPSQEELIVVPRPLNEEIPVPAIGEEASEDATYSIVLSQEDLDMIDAIQTGDDDAILREIMDDPEIEI